MSEPMDDEERRRRGLETTLPNTRREEFDSTRESAGKRRKSEAMAQTLPAINRDELREGIEAERAGKFHPPVRAQTIPGHKIADEKPQQSSETDEVVTSARVATMPPTSSASGSVTLSGERVDEALARELISRRFQQVGLTPEPDYRFHHGELLVTLDGFDPARKIGYQFVSHADADVVTDFDASEEAALADLRTKGEASVLVVHDYQATTGDALLAIVNAFLFELGLS